MAAAVDPVAGRDAVFGAVHQELAGRPTVMVVEDVHWADDATLDVLRYLAWRIPALPSLLVLTYRDDELRDDHPLRRVLGALASQRVCRLALRPLSPSAVEELAGGRGADAGAVLAATAGNPFFVTEVLANPGVEVPATVRDAVLARLGGLGERTQRALELLSTVPGRPERWLVERLLGDAAALDEAERRGVLEADPGMSGSATSWPGGPSSASSPRAPASPATGGSWPSWPGAPTSSCRAWPTTPTGPATPRRSSATAWPPPGRRPGPAPSPRPWPTTSSSWAGPASCRASGWRPCWRRASGCSTTCPASTRR